MRYILLLSLLLSLPVKAAIVPVPASISQTNVSSGWAGYGVAVSLTGTGAWSLSTPVDCGAGGMLYSFRFVKTAGTLAQSISGSGAQTIYVWSFVPTNSTAAGTLSCTIPTGSGNISITYTEIITTHGHRGVRTCFNPALCDSSGNPLVGGSTTAGYWYQDKVTCPAVDCALGGTATPPAVGATKTDARFGGTFRRITSNAGGTATCHYYVERPYADLSGLLYLMYPCAGFGQPASIYDNLGNIVLISGSSLRAWWSALTPGKLCRLGTTTLTFDRIECGTWDFSTHTFSGFTTYYTDTGGLVSTCDIVSVICMGGALRPNALDQVIFNNDTQIKVIGLNATPPITVPVVTAALSLVPDYLGVSFGWKNWQWNTSPDLAGRYWIRMAGPPSITRLMSWTPGTPIIWEGGIDNPYNSSSSAVHPMLSSGYRWALPIPDSTLTAGHADFIMSGGEAHLCSPTEVSLPDTMELNMCYKLSAGANWGVASESGGGANMQHSIGSTDYIAAAAFGPVIAVSGGTHTYADVVAVRVALAVGNGVTTTFTFTDTIPGTWTAGTLALIGGTISGGAATVLDGHHPLTGCSDTTHCTMLSAFNGTTTANTGVATEDVPWANAGVSGQEIDFCRVDNWHCRRFGKWCNAPFDHSWNAPDLSSMLNPTISINMQGTEAMGHCNWQIPEATADHAMATNFATCAGILPNEFDCSTHGIYATPGSTTVDLDVYVSTAHIAYDCVVMLGTDPDLQSPSYSSTLTGGATHRHVQVTGLSTAVLYYYSALCGNDEYGWSNTTTVAGGTKVIYIGVCVGTLLCTPPVGTVAVRVTVSSNLAPATVTCSASPCQVTVPTGGTGYKYLKEYLGISGNVIFPDPIPTPLNIF